MGGFSRTELRLREAWGCEGAYFWRLLLDAAAREVEPGSFTYRTDAEAWTKFGVIATAFSLDEFFALTGRMRQTTKATRNRITVVAVTNWDEWQNVRKTPTNHQPNADQTLTERQPNAVGSQTDHQPITDASLNGHKKKPCSEAQSTDKLAARSVSDTDAIPAPTVTYTDTGTKEPPVVPLAGDLHRVYDCWRSERGKTNARYDTISKARRQKIIARLREFSLADLERAIRAVALDPWDERSQHDDLTIILRSREQVEKFLAFADDPPAKNGRYGVSRAALVADVRALAEQERRELTG